jgi:hypothetical protein
MTKLFTLFLILIPAFVFAQFSGRSGDSTTYKLGGRPVKGYKVLTLSLDPVGIFNSDESFYKKVGLTDGNLFNGKYFFKDNMAARLGMRIFKDGQKSKGAIDVAFAGGNVSARELREVETEYILVPGVEKHFSNTNIFDVYVAGDLYLGFGRRLVVDNTDYSNGFYERTRRTTPKYMGGFGALIGVNVFVLDLPISVGVEYGLNAVFNFANKTKVISEVKDATGETSNTYYTQEKDPFGNADNNKYSSLKSTGTYVNTATNFKINVNFYFR